MRHRTNKWGAPDSRAASLGTLSNNNNNNNNRTSRRNQGMQSSVLHLLG